ncbi:uncharacterized protein DUF4055 [Acinetobacter calcoaceticus]|uniref:Uncharacterized protein DUF4055 n=1 Tax=Acinetobacter calcoaceticus TaxID=471 RepID=A0A4R1XGL1_ACICA|nr:uncharacterized protein DUF4055 [Acinetobacter calcoaceticus]
MKEIETKHDEFQANAESWTKVEDVCRGQKAIKSKKKTYLPVPMTFGSDDPDRYDEYLQRAVFYGVTGRTLISHIGSAFNKMPEFKRPDDLDYLTRNADGSGRSIYQTSQQMLRLIMKQYRCGVYVDFPQVEASKNRAEDKNRNAFPMIHVLKAESVDDWDHIVIGNQKKLSYVKFKESATERTEDGFGKKTVERYRVLRLVDTGLAHTYTVQVFTKDKDGLWVAGEIYTPTDYSGKPWGYIPFTFCGAVDNTDEIGNAPLLELADLNLAHYQNSADVEESGFIVGQPIISMPDITDQQYEIIKRDKLAIGARNGFPTKVEIVQASENNLAKQLMTDKWAQMKEMGARLIESGSANKTATQADNDDSVQHSVLSLAVSNISEALQMALRWCAKFALPDHDLSPDDLNYVISQDFNKPKFSEERAKRLYDACIGGNLPWEVWYQYEQTGTFTEMTWDEIEDRIEKQGNRSFSGV